jgi:hypothetical protein
MTLLKIRSYVSRVIRSFGLVAALEDALYLAVRHLIDVRVLRAMSAVPEDVDSCPTAASEFDIRFATRAELHAACRSPAWRDEMTETSIDQALARGEECFAVFDRLVMASLSWYTRRPAPVTAEVSMHFDPSWIYMHRSFTAAPYRGHHLHGLGSTVALRHYAALGTRGLVAFVEFNNWQSIRSMSRAGFRQFGWICLATVRSRPHTWATPGCRPYQFRLELTEAEWVPGSEART